MALKIVASNSHTDIERFQARERLTYPLRELTANLLRLCRGGGHAERLPDQIVAVAESFGAFREVHGRYPFSEELRAALNPDDAWRELRPTWLRSSDSTDTPERRLYLEREAFTAEVRDASLQIVASMLLHQIPQLGRGEQDFWRSFYRLRDVHDEQTALWNQKRTRTKPRRQKARKKDGPSSM
jgi:hypothetical protein